MKCVRCGTELKAGDKFCLGCGFEVGKEYIPDNVNETLESIMELPEEKEEKEPAEEMEINDSLEETEMIDGKIIQTRYSIGESLEKIKKSKKFNYIFIGIIILILILSLIIYFNFNKITCLFTNCNSIVIVKPDDKKKNIINHPTTLYSFDSAFLFRINDLWVEKDINSLETINFDIKDTKMFVKDSSEFDLNKYVFNENNINSYLKYIGEENADTIEINKITYNYIKLNNKEEYIIISKDAIYVFSFIGTTEEDMKEILNTVIYYR